MSFDRDYLSDPSYISDHVLLTVLRFFLPKEIGTMSLVSKRFNDLAQNQLLWKEKHKIHFPEAHQKIVAKEKRINDFLKAMSEEDRRKFSHIVKKLEEELKSLSWQELFLSNYKKDGLRNEIKFIFYPLKEGHLEVLKKITLDMINIETQWGESILSLTRKKGNQIVLDAWYQMAKEKKFQQKDPENYTLLHWAIMLNQSDNEISGLILEHPEWLNQQTTSGVTPLMIAVEQNQELIVLLLLKQQQIDLFSENESHSTAFHYAVIGGNHAIVQALFLKSSFLNLNLQIQKNLMIMAVQLGHVELVKMFADQNSTLLSTKSTNQMTLLMLAAEKDHGPIVSFLLEKGGINFNVYSQYQKDITKNNLKAIHFAAMNGSVRNVEAILKAMNEEQNLELLQQLLLIAVKYKHLKLVEFLIAQVSPENKFNLLHCENDKEETPLFLAIHNEDNAMIILLIKYGALDGLADPMKEKLLLLSSGSGYLHIVKLLLDAFSSSSFFVSETVEIVRFLLATREGDLTLLKKMLEVNPSLLNKGDQYSQTPLIWAASKGHHDIVNFLLGQPGINLNAVSNAFPNANFNGCTALYWAVEKGHREIVKTLIQANVNAALANDLGEQALHRAVFHGHLDIVKELIKYNSNLLNQLTTAGESPLILACRHEKVLVAKFLLQQKDIQVNVSPKDIISRKQYGCPPPEIAFNYAVDSKNHALVELLLNAGADPKILSSNNFPVIYIAACNQDEPMMQLLLEKDSSLINQINTDGDTPLMLASIGNTDEEALPIVRVLLTQPGIEVWKMVEGLPEGEDSKNGWTALHYAANYGCDETVKLLLRHSLPDSLAVPVPCEDLNKKTKLAVDLLQFILNEKNAASIGYSPTLFSNKKQKIADVQQEESLQVHAATVLMHLIIHDLDPKAHQDKLVSIQDTLIANEALKAIYDELCEEDLDFRVSEGVRLVNG